MDDPLTPRLVIVTWLDSWFDAEWDPNEKREEHPVQTVGWLVEETPGKVSVAAERLPDGGFRAVTHIYKSITRSVRGLEVYEEELGDEHLVDARLDGGKAHGGLPARS